MPALLVQHRRPGLLPAGPRGGRGAGRRRDRQGRRRPGADDRRRGRRAALPARPPARPRSRGRCASRRSARAGRRRSGRSWTQPGARRPATPGWSPPAPPPAWPGFRPLRVTGDRARRAPRRLATAGRPGRRAACPPALPGQFLTVRLRPDPDRSAADPQLLAVRAARRRRVPDQREAGAARRGQRVPARARRAPATRSTSPRRAARSPCAPATAPVLLVSGGVGATPVLAMLHALAADRSTRDVWWLHGARNGAEQPFAAEAAALLARAARRPARTSASAVPARRPAGPRLRQRRPAVRGPAARARTCRRDADAYLCGPAAFMHATSPRPRSRSGCGARDPHRDLRRRRPALTPGIAPVAARPPHPPAGPPGTGPAVSFVRSDLTVPWRDGYAQPARARRGVRRAGPLVLPDRRVPHLRERPAVRRGGATTRSRSTRPPTATC